MLVIDRIISLSNDFEDYVIDIRRRLHANPELSFKEFDTSALVASELEKLNLPLEKGIVGTGLLARLDGYDKGKTILIRADMDALPIEEDVNLNFKSKNPGIMHACGHDVHTANLLGLAKILNELRDEFKGQIIFMFQPGEERGGGCRKMIESGALDLDRIDAALGLHIMPIEEGKILLSKGNITASSDGFTIKVFGKSAHTSQPQDGLDAINIASHLVVSLNSIISKNLDPRETATFSIGRIQGGRSNNIVPDYVELGGMIRSTSEESRNIIKSKLETLSKDLVTSFGGRAEIEIRPGYPSIVNDGDLYNKLDRLFKANYKQLVKGIKDDFREEDLSNYILAHKPLLTADDFGYLAEKVPSLYYMIGTGDHGPLHSPKFYVNEDYIKLASRTMALAVLGLLD